MKKTNIESSREERSGKERGREKKIYRADERMGEERNKNRRVKRRGERNRKEI